MNISKALKEKNKLALEYQKVLRKALQNNSSVVGSEKNYSGKELLTKAILLRDDLIVLKTKIHTASQPIREKIFAISELKSYLQSIESMPTKNGKEVINNYNGNTETLYVAEITQIELDEMVENVKAGIELMQDEIDTFNAITSI